MVHKTEKKLKRNPIEFQIICFKNYSAIHDNNNNNLHINDMKKVAQNIDAEASVSNKKLVLF